MSRLETGSDPDGGCMKITFVSERITILGRHQANLAAAPWGQSKCADSLTVILNGHFQIDQQAVPGYIELDSPRPDADLSDEEFIGEARLESAGSGAWAHLSMPRSNLMSLASVAGMSEDAIHMALWVDNTPLSMKSVTAVEWEFDSGREG